MSYDPNIHHRHSIRLKGYDYAQGGLYFITICVQGRDCLLGNVANGVMVPNDAGRMVAVWYAELENKFPSVRCHAMVVMPNHFHCILEIVDGTGMGDNVDGMVLDECDNDDDMIKGAHVGAPPHEQPGNDNDISGMGANVDETALDEYDNDDCTIKGAHVGAPPRGRPIGCDGRPENDDDISGMGANVDGTALDEYDNDDDTIKGAHVGAPPHEQPRNDDDISGMGANVDETALDEYDNDDYTIKGAHVGAPPHEQPGNDDNISGMGANVDETALDECDNDDDMIKGAHVGAPPRGCPIGCDGRPENDDISGTHVDETFKGTHGGVPLHAVVGWFKTMTTNAYIRGVKNNGWKPFYGKLWQRNYYEHIIRNEKSYHNISEYIVNNPSKWDADKLNPQK